MLKVGNDNGETVAYGKNMQNMQIYEDWSSVVTKLYPVGYDGLMLPEKYIESDLQYNEPYTRTVSFESNLEIENATEGELINELRTNANKYLEENEVPKVSYVVTAIVNERLEIGDTVHVKHPLCNILTEVLEYEYNIISQKMKSITFGNYSRDVKTKFDTIKENINTVVETLSKQEITIKHQTNLINSLNKNGFVYIDDNEILILDKLPKEEAENVWRFGLGGIGFSSNGYEGPFETAITMDGQINANFITTGTMSVSRIEGLENTLNNINTSIQLNGDNITSLVEEVDEQNSKINEVTQTVNELRSQISEVADVTQSADGYGSVSIANINESEPVRVKVRPVTEDIAYLYASNNLYAANDLYLKNRKIRFATENYSIDWEIPANLLYYDSENYDELILDYESQTCVVNKKVGYNADGTKYLLAIPTTNSYPYPNIPLEEGDYTITVLGYPNAYLFVRLMVKNLYTTQFATKAEVKSTVSQTSQQIKSEVDAKFTNYSTTVQMNSAIDLKVGEINIELDKKVNNEDFTKASIILKLNDTSSQAKINADVIDLNANKILNLLAGNEINLTSNNIGINSTNFIVSKNGDMTCSNANITGGKIVLTSDESNPKLIIKGSATESTYTEFSSVTIKSYYEGAFCFGLYPFMGLMTLKNRSNSNESVSIAYNLMTISDYLKTTTITPEEITTPLLTQTSLKSKKKNIKKTKINALELIKNADICEYNLKGDKPKSKKHIGLVIGEGYKCPKEVISEDGQGIEAYSQRSISWKAIQELLERVERLEAK